MPLAHRVAAAAGWMVAFRWLDRLIGLASIAILARLLLPEDFGLVAYAMIVIGMVQVFTEISTDVALIRERSADAAYYSAAWTMNVIRGVVLAAVLAALAYPAAAFFREPRVAPVLMVLALTPLISGLENVGVIDFRKHLEFEREFRFLVWPRVTATLATIGLAAVLRSHWALVTGAVLTTSLRSALSYAVHPFRPTIELARIPEIFRFSRWLMLQNVLNGLNQKLPALMIGRATNSSALAFFNVSKEIADLSRTEIGAPVRRALYPGLAVVAARRESLADALVEATGLLALVALPVPIGIALVARDLVPLFLGWQWYSVTTLLPPLCLAAAFSVLGTNSALAYMASSRTHLIAAAAGIRLLLLLPALYFVAPAYGAEGVAYALAAIGAAMLCADYLLTDRLLHIDRRRLLAAVARPVVAAAAMCPAVLLLRAELGVPATVTERVGALALSVLAGATVYSVVVIALWAARGRPPGAEQRILGLLRGLRQRPAREPLI
jgi:lipopolysaccharide exporter